MFSISTGRKKKRRAPGPFSIFLGPPDHFEVLQNRNFGFGMCPKAVGCYHVLSVSVVSSVSGRVSWSQMTCFLRCAARITSLRLLRKSLASEPQHCWVSRTSPSSSALNSTGLAEMKKRGSLPTAKTGGTDFSQLPVTCFRGDAGRPSISRVAVRRQSGIDMRISSERQMTIVQHCMVQTPTCKRTRCVSSDPIRSDLVKR